MPQPKAHARIPEKAVTAGTAALSASAGKDPPGGKAALPADTVLPAGGAHLACMAVLPEDTVLPAGMVLQEDTTAD